jgi:uncharacterized protein YqjF (DUF2071 family)
MTERPLLHAEWRDLLLINFRVPVETVARLAPHGTEPDLHDGQTFVSVVGFDFRRVRLWGMAFPGHTSFPEINLRYYVRRKVGGEVRRGVVFLREVVPRRAAALMANFLFHENYIARPMRNEFCKAGKSLAPGDTLEYAWATRPGRGTAASWNRLSARVAGPLQLPTAGSLEEFIVEHYWGYVRGRDGSTREYRVVHEPWHIAPADNVAWECNPADIATIPLAEYLSTPPHSTIIAAGSAVSVYRACTV